MLERIFETMEKIGWHLDDFKEVLEIHKQTLEEICEDEKMEDTNVQYAAQFLADFVLAVEMLDKEGKENEMTDTKMIATYRTLKKILKEMSKDYKEAWEREYGKEYTKAEKKKEADRDYYDRVRKGDEKRKKYMRRYYQEVLKPKRQVEREKQKEVE